MDGNEYQEDMLNGVLQEYDSTGLVSLTLVGGLVRSSDDDPHPVDNGCVSAVKLNSNCDVYAIDVECRKMLASVIEKLDRIEKKLERGNG